VTRIPIIRRDADGTITDGTARVTTTHGDSTTIDDFRDLDGELLHLPPGAAFEIQWGQQP
jgi:hypothetical protein